MRFIFRLWTKFKSRLCSNFCRAAAFVSVLRFGYNVVQLSALTPLITYFINKPNNYHLVRAAVFVLILKGISAAIGIFVVYLLDALFSRIKILICCFASTIVGLVLLTLGAGDLFLNITAVIFLAVGEGVHPHLNEFLEDQLRAHKQMRNIENDQIEDPKPGLWLGVPAYCSLGATLVITNYLKKVIYISPALVLFGTSVLFLCGIPYYHSTNFTGNQTHLSPQVKIRRSNNVSTNKAAIIESSNLNQEEQERAGRLYTVTLINESKPLLKMIPMWTTFLVFGLVASTGNTFFRAQGTELDSTGFKFYIVVFLKNISKGTLSSVLSWLYKFFRLERVPEAQNKLAKLMRIWIGMVLCTIFCTVAWRVEVRRLRQGRKGKNMNIFWLAPQYCLMGLMESCSSDGLKAFTIDELPKSLKIYASAMNRFVIEGIGNYLSIFFMLASRSLFGSSLNESRLDTYYKILMIMSFVNVCYYYIISTFYRPISYERSTW